MAKLEITKNLGLLLLSIFLILYGLAVFVPALRFDGLGYVQAGLALVAGVLILLGR